jgi:hypothetical protein
MIDPEMIDREMMERDEEFRRLLRRWEAPEPAKELDARVWNTVRQARPARRRVWLPIAAGVILVAVSAKLWMPAAHRGNIETRVDATGFRPVADGIITVVTAGEK